MLPRAKNNNVLELTCQWRVKTRG